MALSDEETKQLESLLKKKDEPDTPAGGGNSRVENINLTIDLSDDAQVRRAVRAGYLPESYLDPEENGDGDGDQEPEAPPARRQRYE